MSTYVLKYSHNIIEHLGLKLYQNKPTNVIAELVSNSWDALANNVYIDTASNNGTPTAIIVTDDGIGMTSDEIINNWLVIAKVKSGKRSNIENSLRKPMGRKGIGKLAPFGVARQVELITFKNGKLNWISLNYQHLTKEKYSTEPFHEYKPEVFINNKSDFKISDAKNIIDRFSTIELRNKVEERLENILNASQGTIVIGHNLSLTKVITSETLKKSLGRRFTITLNDPTFTVHINESKLQEEDCFPEWGLRIPPKRGKISTEIDFTYLDDNGREITERKPISYWVGFVKSATWSQDEAGIGIFAHGKLAQDRPFFFKVKGSEIFTRYMYGVIEADWIDELDEDIISTDRTTINWEYPGLDDFIKWGQENVRSWISEYMQYRREQESTKVKELVDVALIDNEKFALRPSEKEHLATLVAEVTPNISLNEEETIKFIEATAKAWVHEPARKLIKNLWEQTSRFNPEQFPLILDKLIEELVPESLSVGVMFSLRIYALTQLEQRIMTGNETQLQHLIEQFPWILNSHYEKFTARRSLIKLVEDAKANKEWTFRDPPTATPNDYKQPDVVFLGDSDAKNIIVVELKGPAATVEWLEFNQIQSYVQYFQSRLPDANILGYLIARDIDPGVMKQIGNIQFRKWSDILLESRKEHMQVLASLMVGNNIDPRDPRVVQICELGGETVQDFLQQMSTNNEELAKVISKLKIVPKSEKKIAS